MSFTVYSIESRKGGVGKTTVALNLAKQLISRGPVLLLDCDITGTSISTPTKKSYFWNELTNVVNLLETDKNGEDTYSEVNLLDLFVNHYLKGETFINKFINKKTMDPSKINVLGSAIYDESYHPIVDSRLLMDEIHSRWLVEFIQSIINESTNLYKDKTVSVIIDNSPGYVGFNAALHRFMAKNGPKKSKFVFITSFDEQDMKSSLSAVSDISRTVENYIGIRNYAISLINNGDMDKEIDRLLNKDSDLNSYFYEIVENKDSIADEVDAKKSYISVVINKVPEDIKDEGFTYAYENVLSNDEYNLLKEVTNADANGLPSTTIRYDQSIVAQYYTSAVRMSGNYNWKTRFDSIDRSIAALEQTMPVLDQVNRIAEYYTRLILSLQTQKYGSFARSIPREWQPQYITHQFNLYIGSLGVYDHRVSNLVDDLPKVDIYNYIVKKLREGLDENDPYFEHTLSAFDMAAKKLGINLPYGKSYRLSTLSVLESAFLSLLKQYTQEGRDYISFLKDAISDENKIIDWTKCIGETIQITDDVIVNTADAKVLLDTAFHTFYKNTSETILRMITVKDDMGIIVTLCRLFIPFTDSRFMSNEIKDYLDNCIVHRTEDFIVGKLYDLRNRITQMTTVENVIKDNILNIWK